LDIPYILYNIKEYQKDICNGKIPYFTREEDEKVSWTDVDFRRGTFTMYVHKEGDVVSSLIMKHRAWEYDELHALGMMMDRYFEKKNIGDPSKLTFIDIGAQVGWYAMNIASRGYKVFAFEPFTDNEYVLRRNICGNEDAKIVFINVALGEEEKICYLYSENSNKDDPALMCDVEMQNPANFKRGATQVFRLDDFADILKNVVAIKMDIEGFEYKLLRGGRKVILEGKVPFIMSEFSPQMLGERGDNPLEYLREFTKAGYKISNAGFDRNYFSDEQIVQLSKVDHIVNIFLIHSDAWN